MTDITRMCRKGINELGVYVPGKPIEEVKRELGLEHIIKLASNENPFGCSPKAVEKLREEAENVFLYPDGNGYYLKQTISEHYNIKESQIILGNGSEEIVHMIARGFINQDDETIMAVPSFPRYETVTRIMGGRPVQVPLKDFKYDLPAIASKITSKTKIIFVCNPNNPTATILRKDELDEFLSQLPQDIILVFDEAYSEYVDDPQYKSGLTYLKEGYENIIVLKTFSKIYGLAGLRIGYGISSPQIIDILNKVREPFNTNRMAQKAAIEALKDQEFVNKVRKENSKGRMYLEKAFDKMGLEYVKSHTNFIFVNIKKDSKNIFEKCLQRGIIVRPGYIFGYPQYLRITIGTEEQNAKLVETLKQLL